MDIGQLLRTARMDSGLSQIEVARAAGINRQTLSRWESGTRPVRSDDADRVLAACGRDVRFSVVPRHTDTEELLQRLAQVPLLDRYSQFDVVVPQLLADLQATGAVRFTRGWAAAALGLPALRRCGGFELPEDPVAQSTVATLLRPWNPCVLENGCAYAAHFDDAVFQREPVATWSISVLGTFFVEAVEQAGAEHRVQQGALSWRVIEPDRLVPDDVDATVLSRWRLMADG